MNTNTVRLDWIRENNYQLWDRNNFPVVMAPAPDGVNGADLLPLSLIGCFTWDVMDILREQGVQVTGLAVSAESQQDDDPPWQFREIAIRYRFRGHELDMNAIWEAIRLSENKYCSIYATLHKVIKITSKVEILEDEPGA